MDVVVRGVVIYAFLLILFRISGQRSLGQVTTFDFVLLLIIAEATLEAGGAANQGWGGFTCQFPYTCAPFAGAAAAAAPPPPCRASPTP